MFMKRKIFTLLACVLLSAFAMAQERTQPVSKFQQLKDNSGNVIADDGTIITIDGVGDEAVWNLETIVKNNINVKYQAEEPTIGAEGDSWWKGLWSDKGVYIFVNVADDAWFPYYAEGGGANSYDYDKIELYFDCNTIKTDGIGGGGGKGHYQVAPNPSSVAQENGTVMEATDGSKSAYKIDPSGTWAVEYFVPWSKLKNSDNLEIIPTAETQIGFDITVIDRELADLNRKRMNWSTDGKVAFNGGTVNENWSSMDGAGIVSLEGAITNIPIDEITLIGANDITTNNGTLQISSTYLPEDATEKVIYRLTNGTGKATLSADGVVRAYLDGTVTISAENQDGLISDKKEITISNQKISIQEVSYIKNGYFSNGKTDWNGNPPIVDGVAACNPPGGDVKRDFWAWTFTQGIQIPVAEKDESYTVSFVAWSDAVDTFDFDIEDTYNGRYSRFTNILSSNMTIDATGTADSKIWWTGAANKGDISFLTTLTPTRYTFEMNFSDEDDLTTASFNFMLGHATPNVYIDSVTLVKTAILPTLVKEKDDITETKIAQLNKVKVNVYPSPATDRISVDLMDVMSKVEIFNSVGQKIYTKNFVGSRAEIGEVANFAKGVYFVKVNNTGVGKFVK